MSAADDDRPFGSEDDETDADLEHYFTDDDEAEEDEEDDKKRLRHSRRDDDEPAPTRRKFSAEEYIANPSFMSWYVERYPNLILAF